MPQSITVVPVAKWDSVKPKDVESKRFDQLLSVLENAYRGADKEPTAERFKSLAKAADEARKEGAAQLKKMDKKKHAKAVEWVDSALNMLSKVGREVDMRINELSQAASSVNTKALAKPELSSDWLESCAFDAPAAKQVVQKLRVYENAERGIKATQDLAKWGPPARKALEEIKADATKLANEVKRKEGETIKAQADALMKLAQLAGKKAEDYPPG